MKDREFHVSGALIVLSIFILSISEWASAEQPHHLRAEITLMSERAEWGEVEAALAAHTERLLRIPGVVGLGMGRSDDGRPAVHVYFNPGAAGRGADAMIPKALGDVPVKVIETDDIKAR